MKLFIVSDIHGFLDIMKAALKKAGFVADDPEHLLVVCGDCFDRGPQSREVFLYLDRIKNKVLLRGNHEDILERIITEKKTMFGDYLNGTTDTVVEFFGSDYDIVESKLYTDETASSYRELKEFFAPMRDYFETENYVFTHGWLPNTVSAEDGKVTLNEAWRTDTKKNWRSARWTNWSEPYKSEAFLPEKTIVCGHHMASDGSKFDKTRAKTDPSPFFGKSMIAIDALTVRSGTVNVLTLEDELLPTREYEMDLDDVFFQKIKQGTKNVEMRLFDEKRRAFKVGDHILFTDNETNEQLKVEIVGLHVYPDFSSLAADFEPKELGFGESSRFVAAAYMNGIYGEQAIAENGALAIRIALLR